MDQIDKHDEVADDVRHDTEQSRISDSEAAELYEDNAGQSGVSVRTIQRLEAGETDTESVHHGTVALLSRAFDLPDSRVQEEINDGIN